MKKAFCLILTAVLMVNTVASVFAETDITREFPYKQEKFMPVDETGDKILSGVAEQMIKHTFGYFVKGSLSERQYIRTARFMLENPVLSFEEKTCARNEAKPLFDTDKTAFNLTVILKQKSKTGQITAFGEMHRWSGFRVGLPKILVGLMTGLSSRFMYVGQEVPLIDYIKSRPDGSVTVEELFNKSLDLNGGNVYQSLLTISNVLSDAWLEKGRENTAVNTKLSDLYEGSCNKFGDWYHMLGAMLAGYVFKYRFGTFAAKADAIYRKRVRGNFAEESTMAANLAGAEIGEMLRNFVLAGENNPSKQELSDDEVRKNRIPEAKQEEIKQKIRSVSDNFSMEKLFF